MTPPVASPREVRLITSEDLHLFNQGTHYRVHEKLGAHLLNDNGEQGTEFAVWAPNAREVSVIAASTDGTGRRTSCKHAAIRVFGKDLFPEWTRARFTSFIFALIITRTS